MSTQYNVHVGKLSVGKCFIESIDLHYKATTSSPDLPLLVDVWAYATIVRYDLLWSEAQVRSEEPFMFEGKAMQQPAKHRYKIYFGFDNHKLDNVRIRSIGRLFHLPEFSNHDQICSFVLSKLKEEFKDKKVFMLTS